MEREQVPRAPSIAKSWAAATTDKDQTGQDGVRSPPSPSLNGPLDLSRGTLLLLQRTLGNRAVRRLIQARADISNGLEGLIQRQTEPEPDEEEFETPAETDPNKSEPVTHVKPPMDNPYRDPGYPDPQLLPDIPTEPQAPQPASEIPMEPQTPEPEPEPEDSDTSPEDEDLGPRQRSG